MPVESVLFLCLVVGALALFAAVMAYADWAWKQPPVERPHAVTRPAAANAHHPANLKEAA